MAFNAQRGAFLLDLAGQAVPTNGGGGQVLNPEGEALVITRAVLIIETPSAGAANIDIGTGAKDSDLSNLISALAVNGAITGKAYNGPAHPAAKAEYVVWAATDYLSATLSAASAAFVGHLLVEYLRSA